jgi:hypothetical protein
MFGVGQKLETLLRYTPLVRSCASRITAIVVLLTCLICPLLEMFDTWDQTDKTGNDTEYALVLIALCVGGSYSFARLVFRSDLVSLAKKFASRPQICSMFNLCSFTSDFFDDTGPPLLSLRI